MVPLFGPFVVKGKKSESFGCGSLEQLIYKLIIIYIYIYADFSKSLGPGGFPKKNTTHRAMLRMSHRPGYRMTGFRLVGAEEKPPMGFNHQRGSTNSVWHLQLCNGRVGLLPRVETSKGPDSIFLACSVAQSRVLSLLFFLVLSCLEYVVIPSSHFVFRAWQVSSSRQVGDRGTPRSGSPEVLH